MTKILYLCWQGGLGGAEIALLRTLRFMDRQHFSPSVLLFQGGPLVRELEALNIPVEVYHFKRFRIAALSLSLQRRLARKIRTEGIHLVHAVGTLPWLLGYLAARLARVPHLWWVVDLPDGSSPVERLAARLQSACLVCNSQATLDAFRAVYPANRSKAEVVYPPLHEPVSGFDPARKAALRRELNIEDSQPLVLSLGRMQQWKGQDVLVDAAPGVLKHFPSAVFVFAGGALPGMEDGTEARIKDKAAELGIAPHCRFVGFRADADVLIEAADYVAHTSLRPEPFGMVIAEAMARGKAVIATDQGGPREIIRNGIDGLLIPAGDPALLAETLTALMKDPHSGRKLGEQARDSARRFDPAVLTRKMENLYRGILEGKF